MFLARHNNLMQDRLQSYFSGSLALNPDATHAAKARDALVDNRGAPLSQWSL
jgi:hypothetical protein